MPALVPTDHFGRIVWIGRVGGAGLRSVACEAVHASFAGIEGDAHSGLTRAACHRVRAQHPLGTEIRNVRQITIVSAEELDAIAADIGLASLAPEWLGATLVVSGIADFSHLPPSSRLQGEQGTTLVIDMQNGPCHLPGREIEEDRPGHGKAFREAAMGRRGVTAWVQREGPLRLGEALRLHIPDQRAWQPCAADDARG